MTHSRVAELHGAVGPVLVLLFAPACVGDDTSDFPDEVDAEVLAFVESASSRGIEASHHLDTEARELASQLGLPLEATGGIAVADVDGDDADDILFIGGDDGSQLFLNDKSGGFEVSSESFELELDAFASGPLFADIDGDSDSDLLVTNWLTGVVDVYQNDDSAFLPWDPGALALPGEPATAVTAGDLDGDSDLDLVVTRFGRTPPEGLLWVNDGQGRFEDQTQAIAVQLAAHPGADSWGFGSPQLLDVDRDGDLDILLTSMPGPSVVLKNRTTNADELVFDERLLDFSETDVASALSGTLGDLNNDGHADWLVSGVHADLAPASEADAGSDAMSSADAGIDGSILDAGVPTPFATRLAYDWQVDDNVLLINDREGGFEAWPAESNTDVEGGPASCIADFNNDGLTDIFQAASQLGGASRVRLFLQARDGRGAFLDAADEVGLEHDDDDGRAAVCFDYDRDGDVDVFVFNHEGDARLYRNTLDPRGGPTFFLGMRLKGSADKPNTVGARISVVAGQTVQTREVMTSSGHLAQGSAQVHFGLRSVDSVPQLRIQWPDGDEDTLLQDVPFNDVLTVTRR